MSQPPAPVERRVIVIAPPTDLPEAKVAAVAAPVPASAPSPVLPSAPVPAPAAPEPSAASPPSATDVIYFQSDAYKVEPRYQAALAAHAKRLQASPDLRLRVQAFTDRHGDGAYNLALSRKRAETVAKLLQAEGAAADQLEIAYHGEGRGGAGKAAARRRVELSYLAR